MKKYNLLFNIFMLLIGIVFIFIPNSYIRFSFTISLLFISILILLKIFNIRKNRLNDIEIITLITILVLLILVLLLNSSILNILLGILFIILGTLIITNNLKTKSNYNNVVTGVFFIIPGIIWLLLLNSGFTLMIKLFIGIIFITFSLINILNRYIKKY